MIERAALDQVKDNITNTWWQNFRIAHRRQWKRQELYMPADTFDPIGNPFLMGYIIGDSSNNPSFDFNHDGHVSFGEGLEGAGLEILVSAGVGCALTLLTAGISAGWQESKVIKNSVRYANRMRRARESLPKMSN